MQQSLLFILFIFTLGACSGNPENNDAVQVPVVEEKPTNPLLGRWQMDSSVFINNGVRSTVSAPLLPTTWTFGEDGSYKVENSIIMPGTFTNTSDSLFVILMDVPNEYEILLLNDMNLQLRSTITETGITSMKTDAFLTRRIAE